MFENMSERQIMDYLVDRVYDKEEKLTEEEIIYGINLCDDWIYSHVLCYWNSDDDKDSHRWAKELVYTTTLKLDLLKLINND